MPKMDGIELLKRIYEQAVDSMLIVLSSHDEFRFAREAIKYNIKEYVLKNECSKEKLTEILASCREKIGNRQPGESLTQEFMERVLNNHAPAKGLSLIQAMFPAIQGKLFFTVAIQIDPKDLQRKYGAGSFSLDLEGLIGNNGKLSFYLFSIESRDKSGNYNYDYARLLSESLDKKVSCGRLCRTADDILPECRNSWVGYQSLFYSGKQYCSGHNEFRDFNTTAVDNLCETVISDIRSYLKEKTLRNFQDLNRFFSGSCPSDVESVINIYQALLNTFFIYNNTQSRTITKELNTIRATISGFEDFGSLSGWVIRTIENSTDLVDRVKYSPAVENAIEFIELNFQTISSVNEIADHVNLSLDYFSRLFKKEVGDTLNSYLINFRLNKASMILISSNLSIQEVAERVGIENGSYFSKCFKKKFHTQPIQFRIQTKQTGGDIESQ